MLRTAFCDSVHTILIRIGSSFLSHPFLPCENKISCIFFDNANIVKKLRIKREIQCVCYILTQKFGINHIKCK
jgi:hypothetical protein